MWPTIPAKEPLTARYYHTGAVWTWRKEEKKRPKALGTRGLVKPGTTSPTNWTWQLVSAGSPSLKRHGEGDGNAMNATTDPLVASYDLQRRWWANSFTRIPQGMSLLVASYDK